MTPPDDEFAEARAPRRLRRVAILVVAVALLAAGGSKIWQPEPGLTMLSRYLPSPQALRAGGCLEIALALWLLSGVSPRLAPAVTAAACLGVGLLIGGELRRDDPLPSGLSPARGPAATGTAAVRRELSVAIGRQAFLAILCGLAAASTASTRASIESYDRRPSEPKWPGYRSDV